MKNREFNISFTKDLVFIGLVTIVSVISVRFFLVNLFLNPSNTSIYTTHQSQDNPKLGK